MSILRKHSKAGWTTIDNSILEDESLSWRAKGIACYLISKPNDWVIRMAYLIHVGKEGEKAVRTAVQELATAGYLMRRRERDTSGQLHTITVIADYPAFINEGTAEERINGYSKADAPKADAPKADTPFSDKSESGRSLLSTDVPNTEEGEEGCVRENGSTQPAQVSPPPSKEKPVSAPFLANGLTAGEVARQRALAYKYCPEYDWKIHLPIFERLTDILGKQQLVKIDHDSTISALQEASVTLDKLGFTADGIRGMQEAWKADWRGKKGGSANQFIEFATEYKVVLGTHNGNNTAPAIATFKGSEK